MFTVLVFAISESGTRGLAKQYSQKLSEYLELFTERDGNLSFLFQCGEKSSHRFVQASTVFVSLNVVSKVKGG